MDEVIRAKRQQTAASGTRAITIRGAREHNLKNVDLEIPRDKLVVFTGLSGSGKSSLAFDTIYAEGQRRHRDLRLHAPVMGAGRRALFARHRTADREPDRLPDGRPRAGAAGRHQAV